MMSIYCLLLCLVHDAGDCCYVLGDCGPTVVQHNHTICYLLLWQCAAAREAVEPSRCSKVGPMSDGAVLVVN